MVVGSERRSGADWARAVLLMAGLGLILSLAGCREQPVAEKKAASTEAERKADSSTESRAPGRESGKESSAAKVSTAERSTAEKSDEKGSRETKAAAEGSTTAAAKQPASAESAAQASESSSSGPFEVTIDEMPQVILSQEHAATSLVKVGDTLPAAELPNLESATKPLAELLGKKLTIVLFFGSTGRQGPAALKDLTGIDSSALEAQGVQTVAIAVGEPAEVARKTAETAGAKFPVLVDADGAYYGRIATSRAPRVYLIDAQGKILWFDIEYSRATRRDLHQALAYAVAH